jgi:hypothetical protein
LNRKFLAARDDLVKKLSNIAKSKNTTLYGLVNQILEQAIRANDLGDDLSETIDNHVFIKMARQNGLILIPEKVWYIILEKAFEKASDSLTDVFYDAGLWYGKYFSTIFTGDNTIQKVENALQTILWNISIFNLVENKDKIALRCIEPKSTHSHTIFLSAMLEGIMHPLGYSTVEKNISRGIILLTFKK